MRAPKAEARHSAGDRGKRRQARLSGSEHPQFTGRREVLRDRNVLEDSRKVGSKAGCERLVAKKPASS